MRFELTYQQARRAATSLAARVYEMDADRVKGWETMPTSCALTLSDKRYRAELLDAYTALMHQLGSAPL